MILLMISIVIIIVIIIVMMKEIVKIEHETRENTKAKIPLEAILS